MSQVHVQDVFALISSRDASGGLSNSCQSHDNVHLLCGWPLIEECKTSTEKPWIKLSEKLILNN